LKRTNEKVKTDLSEEIRSKDMQITTQLKSLTDYELGINSLKSRLQDAIEQRQLLQTLCDELSGKLSVSDSKIAQV
jgi:hypothetical protein